MSLLSSVKKYLPILLGFVQTCLKCKFYLRKFFSSGIEEPYNHLDHLLQEVLDLINSILAKKEKVKLQQKSAENAKLMRDDFAENLLEPTTINSSEEVLPVGKDDENIVIEVIDGRYIYAYWNIQVCWLI